MRSFALLDRNPVTSTSSYLRTHHPSIRIHEISLDVSNEKAVDASIAETVSTFGRIDFAFNNAGIGGAGLVGTDAVPVSDWKRVMGVNATGVWLCQRAQIRQMLTQEKLVPASARSYRGTIVNCASMYGVVGPSLDVPATAYAASKHAVLGMTKADAVAFAARGIKINAVCPGYVGTPLVMESMSEGGVLDVERGKVPLGRLANMEEIGDVVAFLCAEASSYMVGASLVADGGFTVQ